jgi:histidyl-tRNA synthetase
MPEQFRAPRGVTDILPEDQPYWRWIRDTAARVAESFGYREIQTPIFEYAGVFIRPGAHGTDLVDKEVYRFEDRGGDDLVLRPEGTAAVCRAYLEHGMHNLPQPVRLFYISSFFRYDRPQAGRYRMFHQFGIEAIGDEGPGVDAETIDLLRSVYDALGLRDYKLQLNTIGDANCRPAYLEKLRAYYTDKLERMCGDCKNRYNINPLRLLDCKNEPCQPFKAGAPTIAENLCDACAEHFEAVKDLLSGVGIEYTINSTLVRGLDYYTRTAFEFEPAGEGSQQSVLGGGGRYDGLIEQLGGRPTPGIGFGAGIERLILNLKKQGLEPPVTPRVDAFVAVLDAAAQVLGATVANELRQAGVSVVTGTTGRSLRAQMRHANQLEARYVLIIGAEELAAGSVTLRNLETSEQESVGVSEAIARIGS